MPTTPTPGYIRNIQVSGADGAMHHAPTYFGAIAVGAKAAEPIVNNLPDALKQQVQPVLAVPGLLAKTPSTSALRSSRRASVWRYRRLNSTTKG